MTLTPSVAFLIGSAGSREIENPGIPLFRILDQEKMKRKRRPSPMILSVGGYVFGGDSLVRDLGTEASIFGNRDAKYRESRGTQQENHAENGPFSRKIRVCCTL